MSNANCNEEAGEEKAMKTEDLEGNVRYYKENQE